MNKLVLNLADYYGLLNRYKSAKGKIKCRLYKKLMDFKFELS
jgi:hypothetical protein